MEWEGEGGEAGVASFQGTQKKKEARGGGKAEGGLLICWRVSY